MNQWQPIETAPKDGTVILATLPGSNVPQPIRFSLHGWRIEWDDWILSEEDHPTHWMPCPEPPEVEFRLPSADAGIAANESDSKVVAL